MNNIMQYLITGESQDFEILSYNISGYKGCAKKTSLLIFWFAHISAYVYRICKILVPTPHN